MRLLLVLLELLQLLVLSIHGLSSYVYCSTGGAFCTIDVVIEFGYLASFSDGRCYRHYVWVYLVVCVLSNHMNAGFGMMGRHGDLLQDLLEYRVGAALALVQHTLFVAHPL